MITDSEAREAAAQYLRNGGGYSPQVPSADWTVLVESTIRLAKMFGAGGDGSGYFYVLRPLLDYYRSNYPAGYPAVLAEWESSL